MSPGLSPLLARGFGSCAADHRLDALDTIIVAGLVVDAQRLSHGRLGRSREHHRRRVVRDDFDRPAAEGIAGLRHLDMPAGFQDRPDAKILLVDCVEVAGFAIDREARQGIAAMHLGQQDAAGRDPDGFPVLGTQKLRCQTGIIGGSDPNIEAGGNFGRAAVQARRDRAHQAFMPVTPRVDGGEQQQHRQDHPRAPRVPGGEPGGRPADAQSAHGRRHPAPVSLPQRRRLRVEWRARPVRERLHRPVRHTARAFDATAGGTGVGDREAAESPRQRHQKGGTKGEQSRAVDKPRQQRQQPEARHDQEQGEDRQRRPARRPPPFPQQRCPGEPQPHRERRFLTSRAIGHTAPLFRAGPGKSLSSQSGIVSSVSRSS